LHYGIHRAESLLARWIDDEFAASPVTLAEVLVGPTRTGRVEAAQDSAARVAAFDDRLLRVA
jgi:predicted nucleic acid-binding protein